LGSKEDIGLNKGMSRAGPLGMVNVGFLHIFKLNYILRNAEQVLKARVLQPSYFFQLDA